MATLSHFSDVLCMTALPLVSLPWVWIPGYYWTSAVYFIHTELCRLVLLLLYMYIENLVVTSSRAYDYYCYPTTSPLPTQLFVPLMP